MSNYTFLLSAEQCAESDSEDWIAEATSAEIEITKQIDGPPISEIDGTGRPYYWRTVNPATAPEHVLLKVRSNIRIFRW